MIGAVLLGLLMGCDSSESTPPLTPSGTVGGSTGSGGGLGGSTSGGSGGSGGAGGSVTATGRVIVDPDDAAWLAYEGGASYFLCGPGDPEDFLYRGTRNADGTRDGDQQELIDKLAPTGANSVYLTAVRSHGGSGGAAANPFVDSDPTGGLDTDILDQWESWFSAMDDARITIFFIFYDNDVTVWPTGDAVEAVENAFIAGLVDAFEHHEHLIWMVQEDSQTGHSNGRVANIAAAIQAADDGDHAIAVNRVETNMANLSFDGDENIDQFAVQTPANSPAQIHSGIVTLVEGAAGAYNVNLSGAQSMGAGAAARAKSWAVALGGAYVMTYGMDILDTPVSDLEDCGRLREFMESVDLSGLDPHDELAWGGTQFVLAEPGQRYVAYAAAASQDLGIASIPARSWELSWFDAATGAWAHETVTTAGGGDATFPKPATIGDEVAVHIR